MIFSICVLSAPHLNQGNQTALNTAKAVLARGHQINRVFFYLDGVHTGSTLLTGHQDDENLQQQWVDLSNQGDFELIVCVAAALRRGVVNEGEAQQNALPTANLHPSFEISGLGQWVEANMQADRVLTF